jgi:hypothetical protein
MKLLTKNKPPISEYEQPLVDELWYEGKALQVALLFFLSHHRISSLRGTSDTLDDRFKMLDEALK